jgi:hypothetical protein
MIRTPDFESALFNIISEQFQINEPFRDGEEATKWLRWKFGEQLPLEGPKIVLEILIKKNQGLLKAMDYKIMPKADIESYPTIIYRGKNTALLFSQAYFEARERAKLPASDNSDFCAQTRNRTL